MKARERTVVRDVWQNGAILRPAWVLRYTEDRPDGLYLLRGPDKQLIEPGDWLIRDPGDGYPEWSTDQDFRRDYEMVEDNG